MGKEHAQAGGGDEPGVRTPDSQVRTDVPHHSGKEAFLIQLIDNEFWAISLIIECWI